MAGIKLANGTAASAEMTVDTNGDAHVVTPIDATQAGSIRIFSENDPGDVLGTAYCSSPETDDDYRLRVAQDVVLDTETFNYTAQNTGKHQYRNTTMTQSWTTGGVVTNNGNITTTTTGVEFNTYAEFPLFGAMTLYTEWEMSFSAVNAPANTIVEIGLGRYATANPYAPTDGVYFLVNSGGYNLVVNHNGSLTMTAVTFTPTANRVYQFIITVSEREIELWIDDVLYAQVDTPIVQGQPYMSSTLPFGWRHVITGGAAGSAYSATIRDYNVTVSGFQVADGLGNIGNRTFGSYQGLSGGTMGTLASYANSADPTAAAALSNTAALVTGLGGQFRFNAAATAVTDGIVVSYQVPAGTVSVQGKRLRVNGIKISCANLGAAVATTATTLAWSLAFGHTAVSLATSEAAATKAARRIPLGIQTWPVAAAVGATPTNGDLTFSFKNPVYVNPGEFIAVVAKFIVGTATASQVIWGHATLDYGWE